MSNLQTAAQQAIALICSARLCEVNSMSSRQEMLRLLIEATDLLRAALAQPEQVHVAWNWVFDGKDYGPAYYGKPPDADITKQAEQRSRTVRLLYTAPPQRKPLTDDRIAQIDWKDGETLHDFARAIEKAHGIGGEE